MEAHESKHHNSSTLANTEDDTKSAFQKVNEGFDVSKKNTDELHQES